MAQFRTTADILDLALINAGEVINGNSSYEAQVLNYLNRVHFAIIAGGTIPLLKNSTVEIDESWPWARAKRPMILELQPKYDTGSVTLTQDSEVGSFSVAPAISLLGYHLKVDGRADWIKIAEHTAGATAFELDSAYTDDSGTGLTYKAVKLDYTLTPSYLIIDSSNNKLDFRTTTMGSNLVATLNPGTYTPAQLATHAATQMTAVAGGPTFSGSYSNTTRLFTFTTDGVGPSTWIPKFGTGANARFSAHRILGYDDLDYTGALSITGTYVLGGVTRIIEPFKINKGSTLIGNIFGIDSESYQREYPLALLEEGNPDHFCQLSEDSDGTITVRFNRFVSEKTRIEIIHCPVPIDLQDNVSSVPLVPRKHIDILEDAATFYLMVNKSDDRAQIYANLVESKLTAMISQFRGSLVRSGDNFGRIIPRADNVRNYRRRRLVYGEKP